MELAGAMSDVEMDWRSIVWSDWINQDEFCLETSNAATHGLVAFPRSEEVRAVSWTPNSAVIVQSRVSLSALVSAFGLAIHLTHWF